MEAKSKKFSSKRGNCRSRCYQYTGNEINAAQEIHGDEGWVLRGHMQPCVLALVGSALLVIAGRTA